MLGPLTRCLCALLLIAGTLFGQATPKPLEFEVASIRLSGPGASQDGYSLMTNRVAVDCEERVNEDPDRHVRTACGSYNLRAVLPGSLRIIRG
jgi:hypothetical protein